MTTPPSPSPILLSVLSSSNDINNNIVDQLRNHLTQIETNVLQTLNRIQQRKPYTSLATKNTNNVHQKIRNKFFHVLKDVAIKNNQSFDEPFFRQKLLEKQDASPKFDRARAKPSIKNYINDQHLSSINNTRRSQLAPVPSSIPEYQTSLIPLIPDGLSMVTPSNVTLVLNTNLTDLSAGSPSDIVLQRVNLTRSVVRLPRIPCAEFVTRQKKNPSSIKEQEDVVIDKEIRPTSRCRIKTKEEFIEDHLEVIIEQQSEIIAGIIKQAQTTPLRDKKKKIIQEDITDMSQLGPPPPIACENEIILKKTRTGRSKKKEEVINTDKQIRIMSLHNRKKQDEEISAASPKKRTRNKTIIEPVINTEENLPVAKVQVTASRGRKKSTLEISELVIPHTSNKITNKSKKIKGNEDINANSIDTIQPLSPKRRNGRKAKTTNSSSETIVTPFVIEHEKKQEQQCVSTRSSRRDKKNIELQIEKQEEIVLTKKSRNRREEKSNETINTDMSTTVVDLVLKSVTVSAPAPTSSLDLFVTKSPRPTAVRNKKTIVMAPLRQKMSPTRPTQRIQSTSPVYDKTLLPLPVPTYGSRRRQHQRRVATSPLRIDATSETLSSTNRNQKCTRSSVTAAPKRVRSDNLTITTASGPPGKKRNKCTSEKRRNMICDICASAVDS